MHVVIAGGHGKIALRLERLLAGRGDSVTGLIRDPAQAGDLADAGARAVVCDLEHATAAEVAAQLGEADAVVFAAGAGPGSGSARKETVDRDAAVLLADAAEAAGVSRYLMISTMGLAAADAPGLAPDFAAYLRAKAAAEQALTARSLAWTVLRPGRLLDDPGTSLVRLSAPPIPFDSVPRDDVALTLLTLLDTPGSAGLTLELTSGQEPVDTAVRAAAS